MSKPPKKADHTSYYTILIYSDVKKYSTPSMFFVFALVAFFMLRLKQLCRRQIMSVFLI